jgi:hypothetical protein
VLSPCPPRHLSAQNSRREIPPWMRNQGWQQEALYDTCLHVHHVHVCVKIYALFAWLISHQPTVLFSQKKPATSNQSAVLFSQNKPAPAISHQPNEQAVNLYGVYYMRHVPLVCMRRLRGLSDEYHDEHYSRSARRLPLKPRQIGTTLTRAATTDLTNNITS